VTETDPQFSGTFAGEDPTPRPRSRKPAQTAQQKAIRKYALDPTKVVVRKPRKASTISFGRLALILSTVIVVLIVGGALLFNTNHQRGLESHIGEWMLFVDAIFVFALMYVAGRRRR
jgi:hypothetical protein